MAEVSRVRCSFPGIPDPLTADLHGVLRPSIQEAERVFWKLGDEFWRQIVDGRFQQYGPRVFDEGLHGGAKESGFFSSLRAGCDLASRHLTEMPTSIFYKELHRVLCSHFRGEENNTEMGADRIGIFRNCKTYYWMSLIFDVPDVEKQKLLVVEMYRKCGFSAEKGRPDEVMRELLDDFFGNFLVNHSLVNEQWISERKEHWMHSTDLARKIKQEYVEALPYYQKLLEESEKRVLEVNRYIETISREIGEKPFCMLSLNQDRMLVELNYVQGSPSDYERIVEKLFHRYCENIHAIDLSLSKGKTDDLVDQKLGEIASLYQLLEWVHPFQDGQGRTDLVLLSKLLVDEGFAPAILEYPYVSSIFSPSDWENYLRRGIDCWIKMAK